MTNTSFETIKDLMTYDLTMTHFNRYLLSCGAITDAEYKTVDLAIKRKTNAEKNRLLAYVKN